MNSKSVIDAASSDSDVKRVAGYLSTTIAASTGFKMPVAGKAGSSNVIRLVLLSQPDKAIGSEGYKLSVTPSLVTISANKPAGLYYGTQTLIQLLPKEIESKTTRKDVSWIVPAVEIVDYPRFGW